MASSPFLRAAAAVINGHGWTAYSDREDDVGFLIQDLYKVILQLPRLIPSHGETGLVVRLMKSVVSPACGRAAGLLPAVVGVSARRPRGSRREAGQATEGEFT